MNFHYLKLNPLAAEYQEVVNTLTEQFLQATGNQLSINMNKDGTACWIKVIVDHGVTGPIVLADEPESNVDAIRNEVSQESWASWTPELRGLIRHG